ncbi:unnamed protein product [Nippostrongylus brasiliensis]|uniref:Probable queuine tRNA-ribosyltransferase (inferred by orthology to a C. elegans protein) n=1 Tax=Nippostrongylus brasiliensis TaxID=27835 RepID=A0A0N4XPH7_NIPBR|nr:unnamed protein product [Nippostrongylus brasiliensis]
MLFKTRATLRGHGRSRVSPTAFFSFNRCLHLKAYFRAYHMIGKFQGVLPEQLIDMDCRILLCNTYHLGHRPGHELVQKAGGLHKMMNWPRSILTDSGGFQMVSLSKLMSVDEQGVNFESPHTAEMMSLTPEMSIEIQQALGADIMMQLDHVVHVLTTGDIVEEAMQRSIR